MICPLLLYVQATVCYCVILIPERFGVLENTELCKANFFPRSHLMYKNNPVMVSLDHVKSNVIMMENEICYLICRMTKSVKMLIFQMEIICTEGQGLLKSFLHDVLALELKRSILQAVLQRQNRRKPAFGSGS